MPPAAADSDGGSGQRQSAGSRRKGGTLYYLSTRPTEHLDPQRIYVGRDLGQLRPHWSTASWWRSRSRPTTKDGNTPVPDLATDTGTSSDGGKTWTFTLKDGVKWEDGKDDHV